MLAAPAMMRLHRRYGLGPVLGVLAVAAAVTDLISIGAGLAPVGYANLLFVWLAVHQLGFGYADGTLTGGGRRLAAVMAIGGLAGTNVGGGAPGNADLEDAMGGSEFDTQIETDDENPDGYAGPAGGAVGGTPAGKRAAGGRAKGGLAPPSDPTSRPTGQ